MATQPFIPVRSPIEKLFLSWFFLLVPAAYALRVAVQYIDSRELPGALLDTVKIASELAILIFFTLANQFLAATGTTIASLVANGVVSAPIEGSHLARIQTQAERKLDRLLNHPVRILPAAIMAMGSLYYYVRRLDELNLLSWPRSVWHFLDLALYFVPAGALGYLNANTTLLFGFTPLILCLGVIGLLIGFLPLFRFHLTILASRHEWSSQLKELADRIIVENKGASVAQSLGTIRKGFRPLTR